VVQNIPFLEIAETLNNRAFGQSCIDDPGVRVLFIAGGGEVGAFYEKEVEAFDKLFFAGPSGMPAAIFFRDAPLEAAAKFLVRRAFLNGGQYCTTLKRAFIHEDIYSEALTLILTHMKDIKVGDPADPGAWIGPIKVERTRRLLDTVLASLSADQRFLLPPRRDGVWQGPFLVETRHPPELELFGPFLALAPTASDDQALNAVLASRYPFLTVFFGAPPAGGKEKLQDAFGMVYDNPDFLFTPLRQPFGGKKESGWVLERTPQGWRRRDGALQYSAELVRRQEARGYGL
jgi:acyl-CoA reductase-like NAD-dependent aldehyde dehydrogenase